MVNIEEGIVRLARMNERVDRYAAERVEEGDQHVSQGGGLQVVRPALCPCQNLFRMMLPKLPCAQVRRPISEIWLPMMSRL